MDFYTLKDTCFNSCLLYAKIPRMRANYFIRRIFITKDDFYSYTHTFFIKLRRIRAKLVKHYWACEKTRSGYMAKKYVSM